MRPRSKNDFVWTNRDYPVCLLTTISKFVAYLESALDTGISKIIIICRQYVLYEKFQPFSALRLVFYFIAFARDFIRADF